MAYFGTHMSGLKDRDMPVREAIHDQERARDRWIRDRILHGALHMEVVKMLMADWREIPVEYWREG